MKTVAMIGGLCSGLSRPGGGKGGISNDLLDELCDIYPEGRTGNQNHCFASRLEFEDSRTQAILRTLDRAGMTRWKGRGEKRDEEFLFSLIRVYDNKDLDQCEYLELKPPDKARIKGQWRRRSYPSLVLKEPSKCDIVSVFRPYCYAVSDRAKRLLESARLTGMVFRLAEKSYESVDYDLYDEEDIWWELRAGILLPTVSPSMTLLQKDGNPFTGDFSKGCLRKEGFYSHAELHYRREDLQKMQPFDLAHTFEMFSSLPNEYDRPLVASAHFYKLCKQHNIKTGWVPVRIED